MARMVAQRHPPREDPTLQTFPVLCQAFLQSYETASALSPRQQSFQARILSDANSSYHRIKSLNNFCKLSCSIRQEPRARRATAARVTKSNFLTSFVASVMQTPPGN